MEVHILVKGKSDLSCVNIHIGVNGLGHSEEGYMYCRSPQNSTKSRLQAGETVRVDRREMVSVRNSKAITQSKTLVSEY